MPRFVALLRAINVGGHTVRMEALRGLFEELRLSNVVTFIASGNVIFDSRSADPQLLEAKIERHLEKALGYGVKTFLRSPGELAAIARHAPFTPADLVAEGNSLYVAFLTTPPSAEAVRKLTSLKTDADEFDGHEREIYWLRRKGFNESPLAGPLFERTIGVPATMRRKNRAPGASPGGYVRRFIDGEPRSGERTGVPGCASFAPPGPGSHFLRA
jgi:uncharacterized protein (DUF1697 family)